MKILSFHRDHKDRMVLKEFLETEAPRYIKYDMHYYYYIMLLVDRVQLVLQDHLVPEDVMEIQ